MYKYKNITGLLFLVLLLSCNEKMTEDEIAEIGTANCQQQPYFLKNTGLDPARCAFSTSEKKTKGLIVIQLPLNSADTFRRKWQHPSWSRFGFMGPITTDNNGNVYVVPVPLVNVLDNAPEKQNVIYKVDSRTGEMKPLTDLKIDKKTATENVYGLLGIYFDCHAKLLYASSVANSTRTEENGIIYAIDPVSGEVMDQFTGVDAMALCVGGISGEKRLYFGSTRTSDVCSIELTKAGKFKGSIQKEFSLDLLGPRGDDKARKIRFDKNGNMKIAAVEFNYNLTAPTEKQETSYTYFFNQDEKKWEFTE